MGWFDVDLLDNDRLFQTLLTDLAVPGADVAGDLDPGSFASMPAIVHFSTAAQDQNSEGLWTGTLTVNIFADPATAWDAVSAVYKGVWGWRDPTKGIVPGVGAVESISDLSAFSRMGGAASYMESKTAVQYTGAFEYTARNF